MDLPQNLSDDHRAEPAHFQFLLPSSHLMYYEYFPLLRLHMLNGQSLLRQLYPESLLQLQQYSFLCFHLLHM